MDYRRFVEAEAELQKELVGIRNPGGVDIEALAPKTTSKDIGLIACMPHAIEPILLEDNQATIRIFESGKFPAFRHADKTQRINLGWIAEQFRRRHYKMAYINTMLQAADILTKPFTNLDKWTKALELMRVGQDKIKTRKASAATQPPKSALMRPDAKSKILVVEVAMDGMSFMKSMNREKHPSINWVTMTGFHDVNSVLKRKDVLKVSNVARAPWTQTARAPWTRAARAPWKRRPLRSLRRSLSRARLATLASSKARCTTVAAAAIATAESLADGAPDWGGVSHKRGPGGWATHFCLAIFSCGVDLAAS
eukprot:s5035_g2.t1